MKCIVCKNEIPAPHPCIGLTSDYKVCMCMGCEGAEIDVYTVQIDGDSQKLTTDNIEIVRDFIESSDPGESITVTGDKMDAAKYYSMKEFTGF